jgi:hypothetical protein
LKDLKNKIDSLLLFSHQEGNGNNLAKMVLWHQSLFHKFFIVRLCLSNFIFCFDYKKEQKK